MELPELTILSRQMRDELVGREISGVEVVNPKCLNLPLNQFQENVVGRNVMSVECKGKWIFVKLSSNSFILFNPGMGADVIHFRSSEQLPEKYHVRIDLDDGTGFTIRVWWFCYLHLVPETQLGEHKLTANLGSTPLDKEFTFEYFRRLLAERRGGIKSFLLNQRNVAGIGNVYIQDALFMARVHPKRKIPSLSKSEIKALYEAIRSVLEESIRFGGLAYEKDFYGNRGAYGKQQFKIAYKTGTSCPVCQSSVQKIKTGSTSSYICPKCQKLS